MPGAPGRGHPAPGEEGRTYEDSPAVLDDADQRSRFRASISESCSDPSKDLPLHHSRATRPANATFPAPDG